MLRAALLMARLTMAAGTTSAAAPPEPVQVQVTAGEYQVRGGFELTGSVDGVWAVLTDFEALPRFVRGMESSRVRSRREGAAFVSQQAAVRFVLTRRVHLLLEVVTEGPGRMRFRDVSHRDFDRYEGTWTVEAHGAAVRADYALTAHPRFPAPSLVAVPALTEVAHALLSDVRAEVERRAHLPPLTSGVPHVPSRP